MSQALNLTGQTFGKWTVLGLAKRTEKRVYYWNCRCECGTEKAVESRNLRHGKSKSCGCAWNEFQPLNKLADGESALRSLFAQYRSRAAKKGESFALSLENFRFFTSQDCLYCGAKPSRQTKFAGAPYAYNGIDRIDSTCGYTIENCAPCCANCNYAKRDAHVIDFLKYLDRVASYRGAL